MAAPGASGHDITQGGGGFAEFTGNSLQRKKMVVMPGIDAFFDPEPRFALMKEMGIDRTLLWPTLASALEERLADDPDTAVAVIHALNEWMHEHWTYLYADALYSTPIISLAAGADRAIEELEYIHERGARIFLYHAGRAGAHVEGAQVIRAPGVRSLLAARAGPRRRRGHAFG